MDGLKTFAKSMSLGSRVLFILGALGCALSLFVLEDAKELLLFSITLLLYPAFMIEVGKNELFNNAKSKALIFLNKSKTVSKILFDLWLVFGIAGSGFVLSDIVITLSLSAILFLIPVAVIEWKSNPIFATKREERRMKKEKRKIDTAKRKEQKQIELQAKKEKLKEEKNKKEQLSRQLNTQKFENTKQGISADRNSLKEIENNNKESVYQLIKENKTHQNIVKEDILKQSEYVSPRTETKQNINTDIIADTDRLAQDMNERRMRGETVFYPPTWGRVFKTKSEHTYRTDNKTNDIIKPQVKSREQLLAEVLDDIDVMDGHDFEHFCAELLRKNGYTGVKVTPASGDQGADIIAEKGDLKYAIQCKRYNTVLNNKSVQEVGAGRAYYNCDVGVVLTNNYFNSNANAIAKSMGILLWDRNKLVSLIKNSGMLKECQ